MEAITGPPTAGIMAAITAATDPGPHMEFPEY